MQQGSATSGLRVLRVIFAIIILFFMTQTGARAMVINLTYDSSITGLTNATQVEAAINLAAQVLMNLFTNNITVNLTAYFDSSVGLGESNTEFTGNPTYSQVTNYLRAARTILQDSNAVATLPATDPTGGGTWWIPYAEAKAFGGVFGISANGNNQDGEVKFGSTVAYALNPTNRAVPFESDLTSVAEHEISEVMGRVYGLSYELGANAYIPYDLYRFTNSGARSFNVNATNAYFSINNGATSLSAYYTNYLDGDAQDWQMHSPADSFDAYLTDGDEGYLSYVDLIAMSVIGYNLNFHAPKLSAKHLANHTTQLTFTNVTGLNFSILASTNIATAITNWTNLGHPGETSIGNYQYIDAIITNKYRFYRVVLN